MSGATPSLSDFRNQRLNSMNKPSSNKQGSDFFGRSTAISDDGNTAIVGMANEDITFSWFGPKTENPGVHFFGISISISENGNTDRGGAWRGYGWYY